MISRPILVVLLGYLIGIIIGLYCKISIALFIILVAIVYIVSIKHLNKDKKKYLQIFNINKALIIFLVSAFISNTIILILDYSYGNKYKNIEEANFVAIIESEPKIKEYSVQYKIKIESVNNDKKYANTYLYLNLKEEYALKYGDRIKFQGEFKEAEIQRNYKGFNYKEYLKSIGIYGTVKTDEVRVIENNKANILKTFANNISNKIKEIVKDKLQNEDNQNLLLGLLLGYDDELQQNIKENFQNSSLSHILAVSGMHVSYVILGITLLLNKLKFSKKLSKICTIILLIFFIFLTGEMPSVKRACMMAILSIIASLLYRKSDIITNISTSLLIILLQNPFSIMDIGLILSYTATIGIVMFYKTILELLNRNKKSKNKKEKSFIDKINTKLKEIVSVSLSAQLVIFPISMMYFNKISLTFLFSNILVSIFIGITIILGFIAVIFQFDFLFAILNVLLEILKGIANIFSNIPLSKIIMTTPNTIFVVTYYIIVIGSLYIYNLNQKVPKRKIEKQILTYVDNFKQCIFDKRKIILIGIIVTTIFVQVMKFIPKDLRIYFIDVGQGDSSLIVTPKGKNILIDGGGSKSEEFDVGKNTLLPYLLDRGIAKIDYLMISHFDTDHVGGLIAVLENIKISNIIISKQPELCEEYKRIVEIVKQKNIKIIVVKAGDQFKIENNVTLEILYPEGKLNTSGLNNNSIVAKLVYKSFSMLFTGDVGEEAENILINKYKNTGKLKSTILKVAHHGSKTSSNEKFIKEVKPQISLIGVGKNNLFGHPSGEVISTLKNIQSKIFRTDLNGEITIKVNENGIIKVHKKIE